MTDNSEFSDTPTADSAEAFLNSKKDNENQPSRLKQGVLTLYNDSERLKTTLQKAVLQGNPALDRKVMLHRFDLDLDSDSNDHEHALDAIKKGEISITYWVNGTEEGAPVEPRQPKIRLEGQGVTNISLRNTWIGPEINTGNFTLGHTYEISLGSHDPEDPKESSLFHNFYITDQGDWFKTRETMLTDNTTRDSEMTPYDFEIVGIAIKILQGRLDQALSATQTL